MVVSTGSLTRYFEQRCADRKGVISTDTGGKSLPGRGSSARSLVQESPVWRDKASVARAEGTKERGEKIRSEESEGRPDC